MRIDRRRGAWLMRIWTLLLFRVILCNELQAQDFQILHRRCQDTPHLSEARYTVEREQHDTLGAVVLHVATSTSSTAGEPIVAIACKLNTDFPEEQVLHVWIFDDKTAARNLALAAEDQRRHGEYLWHLRGYYELDRKSKTEYVEYLVPIYHDNLFQLLRSKISLSP